MVLWRKRVRRSSKCEKSRRRLFPKVTTGGLPRNGRESVGARRLSHRVQHTVHTLSSNRGAPGAALPEALPENASCRA
jgi:hypothetical protein